MNVSEYQAREYPSPPCWALVADVYDRELDDVVDRFGTINGSVRQIASAFRLQLHKDAAGFHQVAEPSEFAVVLMGKTRRLGLHHCGVFVEGKVLHALEDDIGNQQVLHQDLLSLRDTYPLMEFWAK